MVNGKAANDWSGSPCGVLRQDIPRQYESGQRLDKMPTRQPTAFILIEQ